MQEEYALEGIDWSYVEFVDNQDCLDLLEGPPSNPNLAVFPLIDEACRLPRATYEVVQPLLWQQTRMHQFDSLRSELTCLLRNILIT